jgi:hypothetical protein
MLLLLLLLLSSIVLNERRVRDPQHCILHTLTINGA